ncbi:MAG TPA: hypothetical protein VFV67_17075 [Actinophytocola sp.]|uniref:hypothetical protein n=1 Tax=Actinophytocola sp. TaxID=1872138 RepID=UPI002DBC2B2F|nr:hypothetical protein [Actinophytocola sp.]HEU5472367.1 hypothetical protein [Actinophytocola sp.]
MPTRSLRAGLPSVTIPEPGGNQPFWACRLHALGASPPPLSRRTLTPAKLATAISTIRTTATHRDAAKQLPARLGQREPRGGHPHRGRPPPALDPGDRLSAV